MDVSKGEAPERSQLVAAAQHTLSLCQNAYTEPPGVGLCRTYDSALHLRWKAFGKVKLNHKNIRFELACRADGEAKNSKQRKFQYCAEVLSKLHSGRRLPAVPLYMPADYIEKLLKVEPKHTARPCWETADFTGPVCVLAAWLATLTWFPSASLDNLYNFASTKIVALNSIDDSAALADSTVFISQNVGSRPHSGVFWTLANAVGACGTTVCTDRVVLVDGTAPMAVSRSGPALWRDILDALRILGELYDRASAGERFAYAFFKGLHHVNSVVAHGDEGGLIRDIWRECSMPKPYGGLPADCPLHGGLPTVTLQAPYSALCAIVDSLSLQSAAAVAHCAPLVFNNQGEARPVVVIGYLSELARTGAGTPPADDAPEAEKKAYSSLCQKVAEERLVHANTLRGPLLDTMAEFSTRYLPALARLLDMNVMDNGDERCHSWMWMAASFVLDSPDNRHLVKNAVLAPYFWIEPTTILPRNKFGNPAEVHGWASLGAGDEQHRHRWFDYVEVVDSENCGWHSYTIRFEGARKALWMSCLADHKDDGLAQVHFKRIHADSLMLISNQAGDGDPTKAWASKTNLGKYLWKRGQSKLPHPAECLHLDSFATISVNHYKPAEQSWLAAFPCSQEIKDAVIDTFTSRPHGCGYFRANDEPNSVSRRRTAGAYALSWLSSRLQQPSDVGRSEGGYTNSVVFPTAVLRTCQSLMSESRSTHEVWISPASSKKLLPPPTSHTQTVAAHKLAPVQMAGVHVGPRLPSQGPGAGGTQPIVRNRPDDQSPGPDGNDNQPQGATDGAGAAGAAPAQQ